MSKATVLARIDKLIMRAKGKRMRPPQALPLRTREDALKLLEQAANDVMQGKLPARDGTAVAVLVSQWLKWNEEQLSERAFALLEKANAMLTDQRRLDAAHHQDQFMDEEPQGDCPGWLGCDDETNEPRHRNGLVEIPAEDSAGDDVAPLW